MISLVLYGRNDNYGYNLHKRATLSLNCFAHLLDDPDDEILFVDYNTPDDHATFIEAIRDTLTEQARRVIRVLRVRPSLHQRWSSQTHLNALEPQARNIAIRRTNPANRWILSTNTDIILVPQQSTDSLSALAARLGDGFYELPRFEIPENVWEAFDRLDPHGVIEQIRELAPQLWLDEVVYGTSWNVFDGPGDFQLMLRDDIFAIDGFDERMVQGWHVDSNLCRRMELHRGEPNRGLLDELYAYHCDHTRQVTAAHGANRTENDWSKFVVDITDPRIESQRERWGVPEVDIEELRLENDPSKRFIAVLKRILPPLPPGTRLERTYNFSTYDRLHYTPEHVLPFLVGLFADQPRDRRLIWSGCRADTLELFVSAWMALGFQSPVLVDELCAATSTTITSITRIDFVAGLHQSDCVVLEYGHHREGEEDPAALSHIRRRFKEVDDYERMSSGIPKLVVIVNGVHGELEGYMAPALNAANTPFSTGVRHGYIGRAPLQTRPSQKAIAESLQVSLGRAVPLAPTEMNLLLKTLSDLVHRRPPPLDPRPIAWELDVVAATPGIGAHVEVDDSKLVQIRLELESLRLSTSLRQPPPGHGGGRRSLSRVVGVEDWDDPEWAASARHCSPWGGGQECYARNWFLWERIHLAHGLRQLGVTGRGRRALVALHRPDSVLSFLGDLFDDLHVVAADPALDISHPFPLGMHVDGLVVRKGAPRLPPLSVHAAELTRRPPPVDEVDAVVLANSSLSAGGLALAADRIAAATRFLRPGGVVAFQVPVLLEGPFHPDTLSLEMASSAALPSALHQLDVVLAGPFDSYLSSRTLDHINEPHDGDDHFPAVLWRSEGRLLTTSIWFAVKGSGKPDYPGFRRAFEMEVGGMLHSPEERPTHRLEAHPFVRSGAAYLVRVRCGQGDTVLHVELSPPSGPVEHQTVSLLDPDDPVGLLVWRIPDVPDEILSLGLTVISRGQGIKECAMYRVG